MRVGVFVLISKKENIFVSFCCTPKAFDISKKIQNQYDPPHSQKTYRC